MLNKVIIKGKRGMTLLEVMSVIAIIGMLMAFLVPNINKMFNSANQDSATNEMKSVQAAVQDYFQDNPKGNLSKEELEEYTGMKFEEYTSSGTYKKYKTKSKTDPWGEKYTVYVNTKGTKYVIMQSYGSNNVNDVNLSTNKFGDDIVFIYYPEN